MNKYEWWIINKHLNVTQLHIIIINRIINRILFIIKILKTN